MWGRKKQHLPDSSDRLFISGEDLRDALGDEGGEHVALVGRIFSTGDRYDGYFDSDDWSGPGRELRPFFWWACLNCGADGSLHATIGGAAAEAGTHTTDLREGGLPMVLPGGPVRGLSP